MSRFTVDDLKAVALWVGLGLLLLLGLAWEVGKALIALHFITKLW